MASIRVVTGAARSGKSEWAERWAAESGRSVIYVATAQLDPQDAEWQARITQHQQRRPSHWQTQWVPVALAPLLRSGRSHECYLVDSLGTWLANLLDQDEAQWQATVVDLLESVQHSQSLIIFVAEETGWGLVPAYPIGRLFRDRLGHLVRHLGAIADDIYLVVAGHALNLRDLGKPL
ncbi:MAG: bifunctional adenosylcobinamide kinase/adenosylcobinamide-phosphate guanylyltransferase [Synechococcales bacterium]|nr:bifunctional adenosylcobinamide kinase/adenosylcobinamide-phosphate guanylyltransferase [Synechococcales bacterium]